MYFCITILVFVNFTLCISALMARQVSLSCCSIVYPACQVLIKKLHSLCCPHSILVFVNFYLRIFVFVDLHIFVHLRIAAHKTKTNMVLRKTQTRQMENQFVSSSFWEINNWLRHISSRVVWGHYERQVHRSFGKPVLFQLPVGLRSLEDNLVPLFKFRRSCLPWLIKLSI